MTEHRTDRFSEFIDGTLDAPTRRALEQHLAGCAACAATLEGLRGVAARARSLPPRLPERELWPGIAARLEPRGAVRSSARGGRPLLASWRLSLSLPQLAAAAFALMLLSAGVMWVALRSRPSPAPLATPMASRLAPALAPGLSAVGVAQYEAAIADLERELEARHGTLDSSTVRVVERNLAIIDRAIDEARRALAADPTDLYLHDHLASTMRLKVDLLRRANAAAGFSS